MAKLKRDALKRPLYLFHATPLIFSPQTAVSGFPEEKTTIGVKALMS